MNFSKTNLVYFSATDVSKKYAKAMGKALEKPVVEYDFTLLKDRDPSKAPSLGKEDLMILSLPVYGGRVPTVCLDYLMNLKGSETPCILVATYGNRAVDDALVEMEDIVSKCGFIVVGACAVVGRHSFSDEIAGKRPTKEDLQGAAEFAKMVAKKNSVKLATGVIPGNRPYKEKSTSPNTIMPKTLDTCINCKVCAKKCPNKVIDFDDPRKMVKDASACLRCNSCVVRCPVHAKYFDDPTYLGIVKKCIEAFGKPDKQNAYYM
jgi:NAD-dependent dihydropyrimidine dehydrogenase PreA subunit